MVLRFLNRDSVQGTLAVKMVPACIPWVDSRATLPRTAVNGAYDAVGQETVALARHLHCTKRN